MFLDWFKLKEAAGVAAIKEVFKGESLALKSPILA